MRGRALLLPPAGEGVMRSMTDEGSWEVSTKPLASLIRPLLCKGHLLPQVGEGSAASSRRNRPAREIGATMRFFINFSPWQTRAGSLDRPLRGPPAMAAPFLSFELPFDSRAKTLEGKRWTGRRTLRVEPYGTFGRILSETAGACLGVSSRRLNRFAKQGRFAALACRRPAQTGKARNCRTDEAPKAARVLRIWFDAPST